MNFFKHLHTINKHRRLVRHYCFKVGLFYQGMVHDLSKYSPTEFWVGVKYFQGNKSPNAAERIDTGLSMAWIHHKGRNMHHYEYWTDFSLETKNILDPVPMPVKYFVESVMDRIAACKVYRGKEYNDGAAYEYFALREDKRYMHPATYAEFEKVLKMLRDKGEKETFKYLRKLLREDKCSKKG